MDDLTNLDDEPRKSMKGRRLGMSFSVWRLQTNTDGDKGEKVAGICLKDGVAAMGWSLKDSHLKTPKYALTAEKIEEIKGLRQSISSFDDYEAIHLHYGIYAHKVNDNILRLYNDMTVGDLIWMRDNGQYYLGRVCEGSIWRYVADSDILEMDASNQRTNIKWYLAGDESDVPGAIATAMIQGKTLQRIAKAGTKAFSKLLYNKLCGEELYRDVQLPCDIDSFYSLLSSDDCEDLLCAWLYGEYGYIAVPSTNKKATELYECVLKDPQTGKHIYPQVKNECSGNSNIDVQKYLSLDGEVWLFSTFAAIQNRSCITANIHIADASVLFDFVKSGKGNNYLPDSILHWYQLLKNCSTNKRDSMQ